MRRHHIGFKTSTILSLPPLPPPGLRPLGRPRPHPTEPGSLPIHGPLRLIPHSIATSAYGAHVCSISLTALRIAPPKHTPFSPTTDVSTTSTFSSTRSHVILALVASTTFAQGVVLSITPVKCDNTNCLNWKCDVWCSCYDTAQDAVYTKAGCVGEDTCYCTDAGVPGEPTEEPATKEICESYEMKAKCSELGVMLIGSPPNETPCWEGGCTTKQCCQPKPDDGMLMLYSGPTCTLADMKRACYDIGGFTYFVDKECKNVRSCTTDECCVFETDAGPEDLTT